MPGCDGFDGLSGSMAKEIYNRSHSKVVSDFLFPPVVMCLKKMSLFESKTRKRSAEVVFPKIMVLNIEDVLARANLNYGEKEFPTEQSYIDQRLIPHMRGHKLSYPVIEIYANDLVDNARPGRPHTDIHIIDGAHRIVALQKLGFTEIPFIVYQEKPLSNLLSLKKELFEKLHQAFLNSYYGAKDNIEACRWRPRQKEYRLLKKEVEKILEDEA